MKTDLDVGDRLISAKLPGNLPTCARGNWDIRMPMGILSITVGRIAGPMGYFLTAQITFEGSQPDIIVPLHMLEQFEVQYGDG